MKLKNLPEGHILIWEVKPHDKKSTGIYYPCLVGEHHTSKMPPQNMWRKVYFPTAKHWIDTNKNFREPTEEEKDTFKNTIKILIHKYENREK